MTRDTVRDVAVLALAAPGVLAFGGVARGATLRGGFLCDAGAPVFRAALLGVRAAGVALAFGFAGVRLAAFFLAFPEALSAMVTRV